MLIMKLTVSSLSPHYYNFICLVAPLVIEWSEWNFVSQVSYLGQKKKKKKTIFTSITFRSFQWRTHYFFPLKTNRTGVQIILKIYWLLLCLVFWPRLGDPYICHSPIRVYMCHFIGQVLAFAYTICLLRESFSHQSLEFEWQQVSSSLHDSS